jgi:flagellar protein FliJ
MKFDFAFEKVLEHRGQLEEIARRNWAAAKAKSDAAEAKLREMYDEIDEARSRAGRITREGGPQSMALMQVDEFIIGQKVRIEIQRAEIRTLLAETERLHELLVEAAKEKKILEKLKEKKFEQFKQKLKKLELKEIDEIVVTRFGRSVF